MSFNTQYRPQGDNNKNRRDGTLRQRKEKINGETSKRLERRPVHKPPKKDR